MNILRRLFRCTPRPYAEPVRVPRANWSDPVVMVPVGFKGGIVEVADDARAEPAPATSPNVLVLRGMIPPPDAKPFGPREVTVRWDGLPDDPSARLIMTNRVPVPVSHYEGTNEWADVKPMPIEQVIADIKAINVGGPIGDPTPQGVWEDPSLLPPAPQLTDEQILADVKAMTGAMLANVSRHLLLTNAEEIAYGLWAREDAMRRRREAVRAGKANRAANGRLLPGQKDDDA